MLASKRVRARYADNLLANWVVRGVVHGSRCSGGARDLTVLAVGQATVRYPRSQG